MRNAALLMKKKDVGPRFLEESNKFEWYSDEVYYDEATGCVGNVGFGPHEGAYAVWLNGADTTLFPEQNGLYRRFSGRDFRMFRDAIRTTVKLDDTPFEINPSVPYYEPPFVFNYSVRSELRISGQIYNSMGEPDVLFEDLGRGYIGGKMFTSQGRDYERFFDYLVTHTGRTHHVLIFSKY